MSANDPLSRAIRVTLWDLLANTLFGAYYVVFGIRTHSWWLLSVGAYYVVLSVVRLAALKLRRESAAKRFAGGMLMLMALPLIGTVVLSVVADRGVRFDMITMIAIAAYSFAKIGLAIFNLISSRKKAGGRAVTLRCISLADAFVSVFSLQRSMLVSFEGMTEGEIMMMNTATGSMVCVSVLLLGFLLIKK